MRLLASPSTPSGSAPYFAASSEGQEAAQSFLSSDLGLMFVMLFGAAGVVIVGIAIMKSVGGFIGGKPGKALGILVGGFVVAGLCFSMALIPDLLALGSDFWRTLIDSAHEMTE